MRLWKLAGRAELRAGDALMGWKVYELIIADSAAGQNLSSLQVKMHINDAKSKGAHQPKNFHIKLMHLYGAIKHFYKTHFAAGLNA